MPVYTITDDPYYDEAAGGNDEVNEILDGDFKEAFPIGIDFDPGVRAAFYDDGMIIHQDARYQGLPVDMSGVPKKIRWGGRKRALGDLQMTASHFLVSLKLRDVIERLEPGVHQFQSTEIIWKKDNSHVADFFWFNPCNRIDAIDKDHSTHPFKEKAGKWDFVDGGKYVVSLAKIAGKHIWVDSRTYSRGVWVSEGFYKAAEEAGIKGIKFSRQKVI
ncbi:hypothetical protein MXMO3_02499 [Maritalea myrionectae]|uniref:Immunity MXAN-0049 protein domain-containing protein n=2 Tax=Maritalea myrionectae TaxID=454601 RepID=A0A2R4MG39_9HYPH|nr:hypothetical protein MXMO3_02499 [Maritalea myrionectae]